MGGGGRSPRHARLEEEIRSVLSDLLIYEVKDPRLKDVTVSGVELTADGSLARIYYSLWGGEEKEQDAAEGFKAASGFLRRELARRIRFRTIPRLEFYRDTSYAYADKMERLLDKLKREGLIPPPEEEEESQ